jgi:hypothetical protein
VRVLRGEIADEWRRPAEAVRARLLPWSHFPYGARIEPAGAITLLLPEVT